MNIQRIDAKNCSVYKLSEIVKMGVKQAILSAISGRVFVVGENNYYLGCFSVDSCDKFNKIDNLRQIPVVTSESDLTDASIDMQARCIFSSEDGWKYGILPVVNNRNKFIGGIICIDNRGITERLSYLTRLQYYKEKKISLEVLFTSDNFKRIAFWGVDELSLSFANEIRYYMDIELLGIYDNVKLKEYNEIDYMNYDIEVNFVHSILDIVELDVDLIIVTDWTMRNIEKLVSLGQKTKIKYVSRYLGTNFKISSQINSAVEKEYLKDIEEQGIEMLRVRVPQEKDMGLPAKAPDFSVPDRFLWLAQQGGWEKDSSQLNEFNEARKEVCKNIKKENGLRYYADFRSDNLNYINRMRIVLNAPENYDNTIYLIGPCIVVSFFNTDKNSLGYAVQRSLMEHNLRFKVVALGVPNDADRWYWIELLKCQKLKFGDKIFLFDQTFRMKEWDLDLLDTFNDLYKEYGIDFYYDIPVHCGKEANRAIGDFLCDYIKKSQLSHRESNIKVKEEDFQGKKNKQDRTSLTKVSFSGNLQLKKYQEFIQSSAIHKMPKIGSIVMNCNPFTLGHQYLIEYAAVQVDYLYIFVVEEDKSFFKFEDRIELVKQGIKHLKNVKVLPSGQFIISSTTFSEYFNKANLKGTTIDTSLDVETFGSSIAPCLDISVRFVGEEPLDPITAQYNQSMKDILPSYGVELREIPRKEMDGGVISASRVRKCIEQKKWDEIEKLVPETTYAFLYENFK